MNNATRMWIILAAFSAGLIVWGYGAYGREGLLWAVFFSLSINSVLYFFSDQRVLNHLPWRLLEGQDSWGLSELVGRMSSQARISKPQILVIESEAPQALTLGRNQSHGAILLTEGLLKRLTPKELEAVIAYQLACLIRLDSLALSMASTICGGILALTGFFDRVFAFVIGGHKSVVSRHFFTFLCSPLIALVIRLVVSRRNYFKIDALAQSLLHDSQQLASVLWKLESYAFTRPLQIPISLAHMFVVNPLTENPWARYFRSHPKVENRIEKLLGYFPI